MPSFTSAVSSIALSLLIGPVVCFGQSIVETTSYDSSVDWPAPVRNVQHLEVEPTFEAIPVNRMGPALHPHEVIRSPAAQAAEAERIGGRRPRGSFYFPHHLSDHAPLQRSPAKLPHANLRETWKTPYSYGYFGASGTRHWSLHHGYRDRYTEWRLR